MANPLEKLLRPGEGRVIRRLNQVVKAVGGAGRGHLQAHDDELRNETTELRARFEKGETLDQLMPEAFAAVREAAKRTLGMRAYDVQIMGGAALHLGNIAEMKTGAGEGKTLVATLPAYLNAIAGKGVHVITVNDFLASYQAELMGRVFRALGMTTGIIVSGQTPAVRREQYAADITYGTNNEFGFDYLRDNMAWRKEDLVQRERGFAIVDEIEDFDPHRRGAHAAHHLGSVVGRGQPLVRRVREDRPHAEVGEDYEVDKKNTTVGVLEPGIEEG